MSLVLTRKDNESVVIDGNIKVTVIETKVGSESGVSRKGSRKGDQKRGRRDLILISRMLD